MLPIGIGLALGLVAAVALLALSSSAPPTSAERADRLAAELRCPDCQGLSVADSPTRSAQEIRRQIDDLVGAGATDDEVRAHFTARYGEWIRLAPSAIALWLLPFVVLLAGVAGLAVWLIGRQRSVPGATAPAEPSTATDDDRRRVHEEAEALDA